MPIPSITSVTLGNMIVEDMKVSLSIATVTPKLLLLYARVWVHLEA